MPPNLVTNWKKLALEQLPDIFSDRRSRAARDEKELKAQLYKQIRQLKVELDWLKRKSPFSVDDLRQLIEVDHEQLSLCRRYQLLGLARSSFYYEPQPESEADLLLMRLLDEQYTRTPFYGIRRLTGVVAAARPPGIS